MALINLKMPPERATAMADAIERDINRTGPSSNNRELRQTLTWLRYRIERWNAANNDDDPF